jgi:preprotein translocase subunit SecE
MAEKSTVKEGILDKVKGFFKSVKAEIKKVVWPNKDQLWKQSLAVVLISAVLCGFIRLIDVLSQLLIRAVGSIF